LIGTAAAAAAAVRVQLITWWRTTSLTLYRLTHWGLLHTALLHSNVTKTPQYHMGRNSLIRTTSHI